MDAKLLTEEIEKKGLTVVELCEKSGITRSSFYRKLNGETEFDAQDISDICQSLELYDAGLIKQIFLDPPSR